MYVCAFSGAAAAAGASQIDVIGMETIKMPNFNGPLSRDVKEFYRGAPLLLRNIKNMQN